MNVIVFASRKGGSGKSALAAHLAAQIKKATRPCLLVDADPQGSLTLWHKLRGTNEPPIKTAVNSIGGIVATAKRDGIEWVLVDTPPNLSAVVDNSIRNATMVIIPARPGVFDVNAVQETVPRCVERRASPMRWCSMGRQREGTTPSLRIVTIAREALAKFRAPVWGGQITNRADLLMALGQGEGVPGVLCRRPCGGGDRPVVGCDRAFGEGDPRYGVRERGDAQAGGVISLTPPINQTSKERAGSARFSVVVRTRPRIDRHCGQRRRRSDPVISGRTWIAWPRPPSGAHWRGPAGTQARACDLRPPSACRTRSPATGSG